MSLSGQFGDVSNSKDTKRAIRKPKKIETARPTGLLMYDDPNCAMKQYHPPF
jgi:hypothetical protein